MTGKWHICNKLFLLTIIFFPAFANAGICTGVESSDVFTEHHRQNNDYFNIFLIRKENKIYYVRAIKLVRISFLPVVDVLNNLDEHSKFMPGYRATKVIRKNDGRVYTGIKFQADFSFFESHFTNEIEVNQTDDRYQQCWLQLDANHQEVIEKYKAAPLENSGYWLATRQGDNLVEIRYFAVIRPPVKLPLFLYRYIVKKSYQQLFESLLLRLKKQSLLPAGTM